MVEEHDGDIEQLYLDDIDFDDDRDDDVVFDPLSFLRPTTPRKGSTRFEDTILNDDYYIDGDTNLKGADRKPNILLIMADDVGTGDIPSYWKSGLVDMPNIQRLAEMGVTMLNANASPLCAPSRYMLLSGNFQHRGQKQGGTWNLSGEQNQFMHKQKSLAYVLKSMAGYATMMAGKWHIGAKVPRKGSGELDKTKLLTAPTHDWSRPLIGGPQDIGFDISYMSTSGLQANPYAFFRDGYLATDAADVKYWTKGTYKQPKGESVISKEGEGSKDWDSTAYNQIVVEETLEFIENHLQRSPDKPFFAYAALGSVHVPHSPPDVYLDGTPIKNEYPTPHMDMLLEMDKAVGSLVDAIEAKGINSNTVIIFTSDNGGVRPEYGSTEYDHYSSGPLRDAKGKMQFHSFAFNYKLHSNHFLVGSIYEGGTRVPLIVRYDGAIPTNETRSNIVGLNDIFATICDIIGISYPDGSAQDSISFANYLKSNKNKQGLRKWLPTWVYDPRKGFRKAEAIRNKNWKAIKLIDIETGERTQELYHLKVDPSETKNLAQNEVYNTRMKKMFRKLNRLGPCPINREKPFTLISGPEKGQLVSCDFFNDKEKCSTYIDGELKCPSQCGRNNWMCSH